MINRGVALSGFSLVNSTYAFSPELEKSHNDFSQTLTMEASEKGWSKRNISFEYGQKIRWEIIATKITMCNKTIEIPALGIKKDLVKGLNVIEFDPKEHKHLVYTCWMGMMKGQFVIK
jgi:plastocyanin domain-containing protein